MENQSVFQAETPANIFTIELPPCVAEELVDAAEVIVLHDLLVQLEGRGRRVSQLGGHEPQVHDATSSFRAFISQFWTWVWDRI